MTSSRVILINQYIRVCKNIQNQIDKIVLLPIEQYDIIDIVTLLTYHFLDVDDHNYKEKIDTIILLQNEIELSQDEKDICYPIIYNDFILFFKKLK